MKKTLALFALLLLSSAVYAQKATVASATWQTSVDANERGVVVLGLRDKWGDLGTFEASFIVTGPGSKKFRAKAAASSDDWAYINFPGDFSPDPNARSFNYTVAFYANGVLVGRDRFKFKP